MSHSHFQSQIEVLQREKIAAGIESILVFVFALFTTIMLPTLLLRYVFGNEAFFEPPKELEYIPLAVFTLGTGFFVKTIWSNVLREGKIRRLQTEWEMIGPDDCECDHHHVDWSDPRELEKLVDEAIATPKKTTKTKASSASQTRSKSSRAHKVKRTSKK